MVMQKGRAKVVIVTADSKVGGGSSHILGLIRNLDRDKFELHLVCPSGYLSKLAKQINSVDVYNIPMSSKFDLESIFALRTRLRQIQSAGNPFTPFLIHTHGPRAGFFASLVAPRMARKVYTEHIYDQNYRLPSTINGWIQKMMLRKVCLEQDLVLAVSTSVKKFLVSNKFADANQVKVVPNGLDVEAWSAQKRKIELSANAPIIGTLGTLNAQKGQKFLISAFKEVLKKFEHATLEIIGDGPLFEALKSQTRSLKIEGRVKFLGAKENPIEYMRDWSLFALPSISETFGIAALEAMALGIPVVASKVGGLPDIIDNQKNGILVPAKDAEILAKAMLGVLEHPAVAAKLRREGEKRAADFDIKKVVREIEEVYLKLVG
ncbi:MAG: glycosyltransferase family 4 protein [Patescibacteria group bacterium]|jgi:glycosyltransferase involved in cell wall biosynthesis